MESTDTRRRAGESGKEPLHSPWPWHHVRGVSSTAPGGGGADTKEFLQSHGFKYVSVLGDSVTTTARSDDDDEGFVVFPFHWKAVDALYLYDWFDHLRAKYGVKVSVFSPQELQEALFNEIDAAIQAGGFLDILFHPFLHTSNAHCSVIEEVVKWVKSSPEIWCTPLNEVAQWAAKNHGQFRCILVT
ncbi:hypothetical protein ZTR_01488 [Talaromyces verruculosus]|nr:hypothetical protein ZTR_01488 [Talaromyces verruculosus]